MLGLLPTRAWGTCGTPEGGDVPPTTRGHCGPYWDRKEGGRRGSDSANPQVFSLRGTAHDALLPFVDFDASRF